MFHGWELIIVVGVVLLLFGANKIPQLGKGLGEGIRSFKEGLADDDEDGEKGKDGKDGDDGEKDPKLLT